VLLIGFLKKRINTLVAYVEEIGAFILAEKPKKKEKEKRAIPPDFTGLPT
jgi:hypothetical protein